jgi:hypothetical protein
MVQCGGCGLDSEVVGAGFGKLLGDERSGSRGRQSPLAVRRYSRRCAGGAALWTHPLGLAGHSRSEPPLGPSKAARAFLAPLEKHRFTRAATSALGTICTESGLPRQRTRVARWRVAPGQLARLAVADKMGTARQSVKCGPLAAVHFFAVDQSIPPVPCGGRGPVGGRRNGPVLNRRRQTQSYVPS